MLNLDLMLLREPKRFQEMCFRLARYEFPDAMPLAESWDGGRDVVVLDRDHGHGGDVVFQCKFTKNLIAAKPKIEASLNALIKNERRTARWILCVPVDPSGVFVNWLTDELDKRRIVGSIWAKSELLVRLEQHRDVLDTFFSSAFAEIASYFSSDHLELFRLALDPECEWDQADPQVLYFSARGNARSPDLVLDVIVRNKGTVGLPITGIQAEVFDWRIKMHGIPGDGLLFPQITYAVSIQGGKSGVYFAQCEPPLIVKATEVERFKIRITDTGYAWNGGLRLSLQSGPAEKLVLPAVRIFT